MTTDSALKNKSEQQLASPTRKEVSFSQVQIREYEPIWNSHATTSTGPAISLSWKYHTALTILNVDDYEQQQQQRRVARKRGHQLHMSGAVRMERLVLWGYARAKMEREVAKKCQQEEAAPPSAVFTWKSLFSATLRRKPQQQPPRRRRTTTPRSVASNSSSTALRMALSQY